MSAWAKGEKACCKISLEQKPTLRWSRFKNLLRMNNMIVLNKSHTEARVHSLKMTNTSAVSSPQVFHEFHMTHPLFFYTSAITISAAIILCCSSARYNMAMTFLNVAYCTSQSVCCFAIRLILLPLISTLNFMPLF